MALYQQFSTTVAHLGDKHGHALLTQIALRDGGIVAKLQSVLFCVLYFLFSCDAAEEQSTALPTFTRLSQAPFRKISEALGVLAEVGSMYFSLGIFS